MRILTIVHQADAGPGVFGEAADALGHALEVWRIAEGERCPDNPAAYDAVLSLGGSMDADEYAKYRWLTEEHEVLGSLVQQGRPVLGVCLGAQILARADGGDSGRMPEPEIGWHGVSLTRAGRADPLLGPLGSRFNALQWHGCQFTPSVRAQPLAASDRCLQAYRSGTVAWGIQFHAEVALRDFETWIEHHRAHAQDGEPPSDPDALLRETRGLMVGWNALGRGLFGRFLDQAAMARAGALG